MQLKKMIVLSIETAVDGGSLSLSVEGNEINSWVGTEKVSKAEDVLEQIADLLEQNKINKKHLSLIAVSNGPGSSTGVKIGLAIAKGLSNALKIKVVEVSAFEALLEEADPELKGEIITVLPIGKNLICRNVFGKLETILPIAKDLKQSFQAISVGEFGNQLKASTYDQIIFHQKAFQSCESLVDSNIEVKMASKIAVRNLASLICERIKNGIASDNTVI